MYLSTIYDGTVNSAAIILLLCALASVSSTLSSGIIGLPEAEFGTLLMAKILIVEDDEFLSDLIRDCLSANNHEVCAVGTGEDALKQLESETYSVVLLDWQLPDMEGLDVLKTYKQNNGTAKVVMLTGMRGRQDDGMESGADGFLTKPFKMVQILNTVEQLALDA